MEATPCLPWIWSDTNLQHQRQAQLSRSCLCLLPSKGSDPLPHPMPCTLHDRSKLHGIRGTASDPAPPAYLALCIDKGPPRKFMYGFNTCFQMWHHDARAKILDGLVSMSVGELIMPGLMSVVPASAVATDPTSTATNTTFIGAMSSVAAMVPAASDRRGQQGRPGTPPSAQQPGILFR